MTDVVTYNIADGVAVITLNRPERLNAWTDEMEVAYFDLLAEFGARADVRAIVLTGAGRGFCAGVDMDTLGSIAEGGEGNDAAAAARPETFPLTVPKPIIAAINGPCAGLGLVQALYCDVRFVATGAKLTTSFARRGLVAEHGISWILPRLIGPARALDLLLSGRVILGEEAVQLGVANWSVPQAVVVQEAVDYATTLSRSCSPASMAHMKRQIYADVDRGLDDALAEADRLMADALVAPDFAEGVESFLQRRAPSFAGVGS